MDPIYFTDQYDFRRWLEANHDKETVVLAGYYKAGTGKPAMTWSESVDQALCFGWIDGVRRSVDDERYCIRFTPRKPGSNWSAVNIAKVEKLKAKGLMMPAGLAAFDNRKEDKSRVYSFENKPAALDAALEKRFRENPAAWEYFDAQPPSYRRTVLYWIMSARTEPTQIKRLEQAIAASARSERLFDQYRKK